MYVHVHVYDIKSPNLPYTSYNPLVEITHNYLNCISTKNLFVLRFSHSQSQLCIKYMYMYMYIYIHVQMCICNYWLDVEVKNEWMARGTFRRWKEEEKSMRRQ